MYPPVETAPSDSSAPVYFEPLPDIAAKAAHLRQQQQVNTAPNAARLRPKISVVNHDRGDSGGDSDTGDAEISQWYNAVYEQAKLELLLSQFSCYFQSLHAIVIRTEAFVCETT